MTPELWERLKPLFQAAIQQPEENRAAFISSACGDDEELKRELTVLIRSQNGRTTLDDSPIVKLEAILARISNPFSVGELVAGRFRIVRLIGGGGMGDVYEATDNELGKVALKAIRPDIARSPEAIKRFKREVHLARKVSSPFVCRVHELFVVPAKDGADPDLFLTMEFLDGRTLADKIAESGFLPWPDARAFALEICVGLQAIHDAGIVHRDLKTRNVMIAPRSGSPCAVLMDFGLAHQFAGQAATTENELSALGALVGTPAYMAPEQFEGGKLTPATDIYALGIVLYEMITGKHPFAASTPIGTAVLRGRRPQHASSIRQGVPRYLDDVVEKCLEYEPEQRYQSVAEVVEALRADSLTARVLMARQRGLFRKRNVVAFACTLVVLAAAAILWFESQRYHPPSVEAQHWYDVGTSALREGAYVKATRALQVAVESDKSFALAHARLAEAWSELDFDGRAQKEMVLASIPENDKNLPRLDWMYIEAIRSTLTHDFAAAVNDYQAILDALPAQDKAVGYVDLGRAHEKAAAPADALKDYTSAANSDKDNPAAFVRLGILQNKLQNAADGEAAFTQAELLYQETSNAEGLAEVAYQRGYAANVRGDSAQAKAELQKSLAIAEQIPSVQLQIRVFSQLSNVEYADGNNGEAIKYANQAIQLARENGLQYWSGDGLVRLGNAYISNQEPEKAEAPLQEALALAQQEGQSRLEANAKFSLASARSQRRKWDESIAFAQPALDYYKSVGLLVQATNASLLIIRAERNKNELAAALSSATQILAIATQARNEPLIETAEEQTGDILESLEKYPEALSHFTQARQIAVALHANEPYEALHCARVLSQLGNYSDAEKMLVDAQGNGSNRILVSASQIVKANMLLSQGRSADVISLANRALGPHNSFALPDDLSDFRLARARAELNLGQLREAANDLAALATWAQQPENADDAPTVKLAQAEIYRKEGSSPSAEPLVAAALAYSSDDEKKDSEWRSLLEEARVDTSLGKHQESKAAAQQALELLQYFHDTWPAPYYSSFSNRPDNLAAEKELATYAR